MSPYATMIEKVIRNAIYTIRRKGMEADVLEIEEMVYVETPNGNGSDYCGFLRTKDAYMFKDALTTELLIEYIHYQKKNDDSRLNEPSVNLKNAGVEILFHTKG